MRWVSPSPAVLGVTARLPRVCWGPFWRRPLARHSRTVTGYLLMANGFSVTRCIGFSEGSSLLPMAKVPPGSATISFAPGGNSLGGGSLRGGVSTGFGGAVIATCGGEVVGEGGGGGLGRVGGGS